MKDDEKQFLLDILNRGITPRDIINEPDFYMHHKRAWYLLEKWSDKGWYDWGISMDLGWLTEDGIFKAKEVAMTIKDKGGKI